LVLNRFQKIISSVCKEIRNEAIYTPINVRVGRTVNPSASDLTGKPTMIALERNIRLITYE
jgi:hypothetical protein